MHHLLHQGTTTTTTTLRQRKRRLIKIILLITLTFPIIQMCIYFQFPLENLHTLMERTIRLFSLHPSIWEIVENGMHFDSTDNPVIINEQIHKMPKPLIFC
jgi:hypothetical protein